MKNKNIDSQELGSIWFLENVEIRIESIMAWKAIKDELGLDDVAWHDLQMMQIKENNNVQFDPAGFRKWLDTKKAAMAATATAAATAAIVVPPPLVIPTTEIIVPVVATPLTTPAPDVDTPPGEDKPPVVEKKNNTLLYAGIAGAVLLALGITAVVVMNKD